MIKILVKLILAIAGLAISVGAFYLNAQTPIQVGPIPFFGGIALFLFAIIVL